MALATAATISCSFGKPQNFRAATTCPSTFTSKVPPGPLVSVGSIPSFSLTAAAARVALGR